MYVFAQCSASVRMEGFPFPIAEGDVFRDDDPVVLAHPSMFAADPPAKVVRYYGRRPEAPVEQVTAGPGERRPVRRG